MFDSRNLGTPQEALFHALSQYLYGIDFYNILLVLFY